MAYSMPTMTRRLPDLPAHPDEGAQAQRKRDKSRCQMAEAEPDALDEQAYEDEDEPIPNLRHAYAGYRTNAAPVERGRRRVGPARRGLRARSGASTARPPAAAGRARGRDPRAHPRVRRRARRQRPHRVPRVRDPRARVAADPDALVEEARADVFAETSDGVDCVTLARRRGHEEVARYLEQGPAGDGADGARLARQPRRGRAPRAGRGGAPRAPQARAAPQEGGEGGVGGEAARGSCRASGCCARRRAGARDGSRSGPPPPPSRTRGARIARRRSRPPRLLSPPQVGDRVRVKGEHVGTVRFLGPVDYAPGVFVGVHLDEPKGKNNGTVKGVQCVFARRRRAALAPAPASAAAPRAPAQARAAFSRSRARA